MPARPIRRLHSPRPRTGRRRQGRRPWSLRRRLVVVMLALLALGLVGADAGTEIALRLFLVDRIDQQLNASGKLGDDLSIAEGPGTPVFSTSNGDGLAWAFLYRAGFQLSYIQIRDPANHIVQNLSAIGPGPQLPAVLPTPADGSTRGVFFDARAGGRGPDYRVRTGLLPGGRGTFAIAEPLSDVNATLGRLILIEVAVGLGILLLAGALGIRAVRRAMRPLDEIERAAYAVGAGDLSRRLARADERTEVGRLGLALNAMVGQLDRAFARRRASEDRLRRFVADASHELRTPLASIRGYAELFRRGAAERPDDLAKAMRRIEGEACRMGVLVDELLLLARLDAGRPLERAPVDLAALAADAVTDARAVEPDRPLSLLVEGPACVEGDGDRLRQVLANLLANVRAHTPPGTPATVRVRPAEAVVVVEVADEGPGMSEEARDQAFERFFRAGVAGRRGSQGQSGAGLGLSIVAAVVAEHGGEAALLRAPAGGTLARVTLPRKPAARPPSDGPTADSPSPDAPDDESPDGSSSVGASSDGDSSDSSDGGSADPSPELTAHAQPGHSDAAGRPAGMARTSPRAAGANEDATPPTRRTGKAPAMGRLSRFVVDHRRLVALVWLVAFLFGGFASSKISNHLDQQFAMPGQQAYDANQAIQGLYGNGGSTDPLVAVITVPTGTVTDAQNSAALGRASDALATISGMRVASYADTGNPGFNSADGRSTVDLVYKPPAYGSSQGPAIQGDTTKIRQALAGSLPPGYTTGVTGSDALAQGGSGGGVSLLAEVLLGALGALAVLAFVFGSLLALMPLLIAGVSVLSTFLVVLGLTYFTDISFIVQYLIGLIGLGVAIDYSLLVVTRWREERGHGYDNAEAIHRAMATAGRAVAFSGITVAIGLISLVVLPVPFLRSVGIGGMLIPLISVVAALTLLPAMLAMVGRRLEWPRVRKQTGASRGWTAWARLIVRHRMLGAAAALAVLAVLGISALNLRIGEPSSDTQARSGSAYEALVQMHHDGITAGALTPVEVLVPASTDPVAVADRLAAVPGVHAAAAPDGSAWRRGGTALVSVIPKDETTTAAGSDEATRVRDAALAAVPAARVGGTGVAQVDGINGIYGRFPLMLALIAVITFILLARAFRSIVLPLKAVLLNLLSVGATYGVLTLVWQEGHGSTQIWSIPATGSITVWVPLMVFAFLYGLSMDYEVFILARMREEYDRTGSTPAAAVEGIGRTGRLVTSAALILFLAFASLASAPVTDIKIFATGLGAGILLDATVVRALLVPALVSLFGRWNWWLPAWAATLLRVPPSPARREDAPASSLPESAHAQ